MSHQPIQDTISLDLSADKVVVSDTVKIIATIQALVQPDKTDAKLRADIREMMKKLIASAEWQFSNLIRVNDPSGHERVSLQASARVSETENANLDNRAREVSTPGLTVSSVVADTSIPTSMLEEAEQELRLALLGKLNTELAKINEVMKSDRDQPYRVYQVKFQRTSADYSNSPRTKGVMLAATSYGSGFGGGEDDEALGNAQKITLHASCAFARVLIN